MTNEELLKEAKRRYPVGTKFKSRYGNIDIVKECNPKITEWGYIYLDGNLQSGRLVYSNDKWAEIVETPKQKEKSLVGRYVKCLKNNANSCRVNGEYVKKDNYYQIGNIKEQEYVLKDGNLCGYVDEPNSQFVELGFELMPIGWTPEQENTPQFEVGKWYIAENHKFYAKCLKFENNRMFCNEHIMTKSYYKISNYSFNSGYNWKSLTDLSEIQPYLPDNHPDKIIKQESNMFKKGEYIVITESKDTYDFKENFCFKIRKESDLDWDCYIELDARNRQNGWSSKYFEWRYATPEEIAEYDRLGKPYDVTTRKKKEEYKYEIILLNSKEELIACEEYFNKLGYKPSAFHNSYSNGRYFTIYHKIQEYRNSSTNSGYPIVTLNKFGISVKSEVEKPKYEVVHCKTQEEWDFVNEKLGYNRNSKGFKEFSFIMLHENNAAGNFWVKENKPKIYSFQEWCNKFGHKPDFMNKQEEYKVGDWGLLSNDAAGWGASPDQINNKILQITGINLNDNPTSDPKGRYYFGNIRTIGREIVRKALPHEIPQEIINSIPEYVECITDKFDSIHKNIIYKLTSNSNKEWYWLEGINIGSYSSNFFKPSTEEAYKNQFKQPIITKENTSNNDIIEVGDEVEIHTNSEFGNPLGYRGIVEQFHPEYPDVVRINGYSHSLIYCKLIKKASQTTTTYEKQVAEQPKNVPITTDIRIPKSISVTLTNTEKEVKLTIKKPKTIKI